MDGWSLTHTLNTVDDCLQGQIAQKIFKSNIEARPVKAGDYMAFKHCISFATDLAANFGCYWFRHHLVSKLLLTATWSHNAVLFKSEQMPFPQTSRSFRSAQKFHFTWKKKYLSLPKIYKVLTFNFLSYSISANWKKIVAHVSFDGKTCLFLTNVQLDFHGFYLTVQIKNWN